MHAFQSGQSSNSPDAHVVPLSAAAVLSDVTKRDNVMETASLTGIVTALTEVTRVNSSKLRKKH